MNRRVKQITLQIVAFGYLIATVLLLERSGTIGDFIAQEHFFGWQSHEDLGLSFGVLEVFDYDYGNTTREDCLIVYGKNYARLPVTFEFAKILALVSIPGATTLVFALVWVFYRQREGLHSLHLKSENSVGQKIQHQNSQLNQAEPKPTSK